MKDNNVLIIGKTPPPIGGVTIHVKRLIEHLKITSIPHTFLNLTGKNTFNLIPLMIKHRVSHLHSSSPYLRIVYSILGRILNCKTIITYHGDLNRFSSKLKNICDLFSIKISNQPIVLNKKSLIVALKYNKKSKIISSFIPPIIENEKLENKHKNIIKKINSKYTTTFCTNAYNVTYDKNGEEIYGIFEIIDTFKKKNNIGLVLSDPSGAYSNLFKEKNYLIPENIIIINEPHSFFKVLSMCDASIRNTSTDGDSLSIKESLYLKKITLCTDVVSRPKGTIVYKKGELSQLLCNFPKDIKNKYRYENIIEQLVKLYHN